VLHPIAPKPETVLRSPLQLQEASWGADGGGRTTVASAWAARWPTSD